MNGWIGLTVGALVCWGITGVTQKLSTNHVSAQLSFLGYSLAFGPIGVAVALLFPVDLAVGADVFLLGALGGVLNGVGTLTSFRALESGGKASVVIPIVALYPLVTVLGARLVLDEQIAIHQWAGILLAPAAAWLLSLEPSVS
jgi:transporter family protein